MKVLNIICFWLALICGVLIFIQFPVIKRSTANELKMIEDQWLRRDLSGQDLTSYQEARRMISYNESQLRDRLTSAKHLGLAASVLLLIQSFVILRRENRAEKVGPGDENSTKGT